MKLSKLFAIHAVFNLLGGVLLFIGAAQLSNWLHLGSSSNFLWHLLGACSLALAALSFYAISFKNNEGIRAAVITIIIFNGFSAFASIWATADGIDRVVWANTTIHIVFCALFLYFCFTKSWKTS